MGILGKLRLRYDQEGVRSSSPEVVETPADDAPKCESSVLSEERLQR